MIIIAALCGMIAYMMCVHFLPLKYDSELSFFADVPGRSDLAAAAMLETGDFASAVSDRYNAMYEVGISGIAVRESLDSYVDEGNMIRLLCHSDDPVEAFHLASAAKEVLLDGWYSGKVGGISTIEIVSEGEIPTQRTTASYRNYVLYAVLGGFAIVFFFALFKGATRDLISSEWELRRNYRVEILGVVPYSGEPIKSRKNASKPQPDEP